MAKFVYTDTDIEDLARLGQSELRLGEEDTLTDLAYEKARQVGIRLVFSSPEKPPAAPVRPYLSPPGPERVPAPRVDRAGATAAQPCHNPLQFSPQASEAELRAAVVEAGRSLYESGLMISNDGNISVRTADGHILMTPSGACKGRIAPEDLLVIDLDGKIVKQASDPSLKPTSEQPMHLEVYRQRPDVRAVIHTHLVYANALVISKGAIRMDVIPEAAVTFGELPVTAYTMPSSAQNAAAIRNLIADHDTILIRNHGVLAVGKDLSDALILVERLEHVAKTLTFAEMLGSVNPLPAEMRETIAKSRRG